MYVKCSFGVEMLAGELELSVSRGSQTTGSEHSRVSPVQLTRGPARSVRSARPGPGLAMNLASAWPAPVVTAPG